MDFMSVVYYLPHLIRMMNLAPIQRDLQIVSYSAFLNYFK
jgi:hypothetical protein